MEADDDGRMVMVTMAMMVKTSNEWESVRPAVGVSEEAAMRGRGQQHGDRRGSDPPPLLCPVLTSLPPGTGWRGCKAQTANVGTDCGGPHCSSTTLLFPPLCPTSHSASLMDRPGGSSEK